MAKAPKGYFYNARGLLVKKLDAATIKAIKLRFPKKARIEIKDALKAFQRQALHSKQLSLNHPEDGSLMTWKVDLPADMKKLLSVLNNLDR